MANLERSNPVEAALKVWKLKYPEAKALFLAGSTLREEHTLFSDLDLIVIYEDLPCARRESFFFEDWPIEAYVHDVETLAYFFDNFSTTAHVPILPQMISESVVICDDQAVCEDSELTLLVKRMARQVLERGPKSIDAVKLERKRYVITDLVDDLRSPRSRAELVGAGTRLYEILATYFFLSQGLWAARGKSISRRMREVDALVADRFDAAFDELFISGQAEKVVQLAEDILAPSGGFLFEGYVNKAPTAWRKSLDAVLRSFERQELGQ